MKWHLLTSVGDLGPDCGGDDDSGGDEEGGGGGDGYDIDGTKYRKVDSLEAGGDHALDELLEGH